MSALWPAIFSIIVVLAPFHVQAFSSSQSKANTKVSAKTNIKQICQNHFSECLDALDAQFSDVKVGQDFWYVLKIYEFEALFQLNKFDRLHDETKKYVDEKNLGSKEFQFLAYIYHAKTLFSRDLDKKGMFYLDHAKNLYSQLNKKISNPMYLVHFANIILVEAHRIEKRGDKSGAAIKFLEAKRLLLTIKKNYYHYNNNLFQQELYSNLGHTCAQLNQHSATIEFSRKALFWAKQNDNKQQIGISQFNLARSFQKANQHSKARRAFLKSVPYFVESNDKISEAMVYIRLLEVSKKAGDAKTKEQSLAILDGMAQRGELNDYVSTMLNKLTLTQ